MKPLHLTIPLWAKPRRLGKHHSYVGHWEQQYFYTPVFHRHVPWATVWHRRDNKEPGVWIILPYIHSLQHSLPGWHTFCLLSAILGAPEVSGSPQMQAAPRASGAAQGPELLPRPRQHLPPGSRGSHWTRMWQSWAASMVSMVSCCFRNRSARIIFVWTSLSASL